MEDDYDFLLCTSKKPSVFVKKIWFSYKDPGQILTMQTTKQKDLLQ